MASDPVPPEPAAEQQERRDAQPLTPPPSGRCHVLTLSVLSLFLIGFGVWLVFAWSRYGEEYAQVTEGWHVGSTRMVELSLIQDDMLNACAADQMKQGFHCNYRRDLHEVGPLSRDDPKLLQPYNTSKNELFMAAGLWSCPEMKQPLPPARFTVVCNFHVESVMKPVMIRFGRARRFIPVDKSVAIGTLTDCVFPQ